MLLFSPVSITHVAGLDNNKPEIASQAITHVDDDHAIASHALPYSIPFTGALLAASKPTARGQCLTLQQWTLQLGPPAGAGGSNTAPIVEQIHDCGTHCPRSAASYSWATGFFGKGRQVGAQSVKKDLSCAVQAFVMEGFPDPGFDLTLPFTHLLNSFVRKEEMF
jgi:hypothetical protein